MFAGQQTDMFSRIAPIKLSAVCEIAQNALLAVSLVVYLSGLWMGDYVVQFVGVFLMFVANVAFSLLRLETRILSLFLHAGMFLFWLTRPLFGMTYHHNNVWASNGEPALFFALFAILLSMFFVRLGTVLYEAWLSARRRGRMRKQASRLASMPADIVQVSGRYRESSFAKAMRVASLVVYIVCLAGSLVFGYQQLSFMRGLSYEEFYLTSTSAYSSSIVSSIDSMTPYAMCFYLATLPAKTPATIVLLLNVVTTAPELLIGSRGPFVLAIMFLGFYYLMRAFICREEGWITKFEVMLVCVGLPLGVLGMGAMNYLRGGHDVAPESILGTFCDALYKQGVTFSVLQYAYNVDPQIQNLGFKFYTFGLLTHTITQGFVGQLFLGSELLPETNSIDLALKGTLYSHTMSYFAHWNYLHGEGYGTSYLLEAYADFRYGGIIAISLLFGFVFAFLSHRAKDGCFAAIVFELMVARQVFYLPRGEAMSWLSFLWATRFWLAVAVITLLSLFLWYRFENAEELKRRTDIADGDARAHYAA